GLAVDLDPFGAVGLNGRRKHAFAFGARVAHLLRADFPPIRHILGERDNAGVELFGFVRNGGVGEEGWIEILRHFKPPIFRIAFHSSAVTGCTERREFFTSTMSANAFSAFSVASFTGVFNGSTALKSTA